MKLSYFLSLISYSLFILTSCTVSKQISKSADKILLNDTAIRSGHIGISIYEPATNSYWYNYNADKYFIPASNTKLFTLYAGMKYLGDSLAGLRYVQINGITYIIPTGDPTFLHSNFVYQPVYQFLNSLDSVIPALNNWKETGLGNGWAWNDYNDDYMVERSAFPIYGNYVTFAKQSQTVKIVPNAGIGLDVYLSRGFVDLDNFYIKRFKDRNEFQLKRSANRFISQLVPFITTDSTVISMFSDTLRKTHFSKMVHVLGINGINNDLKTEVRTIRSQPTDSLFKPMMHRSDNFFAEQTLLMVSNEHLGYMSDEKIIDTLLKTDLKDVPQKPRWIDGSGLSRYNLFTPLSFVYILNRSMNEFGLSRLKNILPTGGEGTLSAYFKKDSSFIYAKTGTLSNNCALSGYLITQKGKLLIFSVLTNNYPTAATPVRKAVEKFLLDIRRKY